MAAMPNRTRATHDQLFVDERNDLVARQTPHHRLFLRRRKQLDLSRTL